MSCVPLCPSFICPVTVIRGSRGRLFERQMNSVNQWHGGVQIRGRDPLLKGEMIPWQNVDHLVTH